MDAGHTKRIEQGAALVAAGSLAAAAGFAAGQLLGPTIAVGAVTAAAFVGGLLVLRAIRPADPVFALGQFDLAELSFAPVEELVLTDADRLEAASVAETEKDELVLDDVLAGLGEDSRVVRLFDVAAMPTPGQLKARIDHHLGKAQSPGAGLVDASAALHEALAELRSSLR